MKTERKPFPPRIQTDNGSDKTRPDKDADKTGTDNDSDATEIRKGKTRFSKKHKEVDPDTTGIDTDADNTKKETKNKTSKK